MTISNLATVGRTKEWSWSYSKLKNFDGCPKRMYEVDILRKYIEEVKPGSPLDWGNRVHKALAETLANGTPLPVEMRDYQGWIDRVTAGAGKLLVEQKYAITRAFAPTTYFAHDAWYRGIGDVVRIDEPSPRGFQLAFVMDWKTGKALDDPVQLMLMAQCIFSHFPTVTHVRAEYVWLKDGSTTPDLFTREDVAKRWVTLLPRVQEMELAAKTDNYPPKPSGLCKSYCPVISCPYHGKGAR